MSDATTQDLPVPRKYAGWCPCFCHAVYSPHGMLPGVRWPRCSQCAAGHADSEEVQVAQ